MDLSSTFYSADMVFGSLVTSILLILSDVSTDLLNSRKGMHELYLKFYPSSLKRQATYDLQQRQMFSKQ